jgi:hypothetical protein
MAGTSQVTETALEAVIRQVRDLQSRVAALENRAGLIPAESTEAALDARPAADLEPGVTLVPIIGKALLGLSGAYLLRALAEMKALPLAAGVAAGILYALAWLVFAARAARSRPPQAAVGAVTSVLILVPLLWEATVRFHASPPWVAAAALLLFSAFGLGISWRNNLGMIAWITTLAGLFAAMALLIATHDLLPFACMLLALAAAVELSACFEHWVKERWIVAVAADLAVLLMTFVITRPGGLPEGYAPLARGEVIAMQAALLAIYLAGMMARTLWRGFDVTLFEIVQCVVAFVIATAGSLRVAQGDAGAAAAVGLFSAAAGLACYTVSFTFLERSHRDRNFYTYGAFALALALFATALLLDGVARTAWLAALGGACLYAGERFERTTLKWHALIYLAAGAIDSGVVLHAARRFVSAEAHPTAVLPTAAATVATAAAVAAFVGTLRRGAPRLLTAALGALAAWNLAGLAAGVLVARCIRLAGIEYCATVLTAILAALAIALALMQSRWNMAALAWPAYFIMGAATVKLLLQDLRQAHAFALVFSLLVYGGTLMALPRLLSRRQPAAP